jgi:hypothetical protein
VAIGAQPTSPSLNLDCCFLLPMTIAITDEVSPFALRSTRNRLRSNAPQCSIGLTMERVVPVTQCWMVLGHIPAESPSAIWPSAVGKTSRSMMAFPSGDEDGHAGSPEQTLSH